MSSKEVVLKEAFGFDSFRNYQSEIIDSVFDLDSKGVLAVMPTSAGKSLLYQLPALMLNGLTVVISPLISLMKDQIDYLKSKNIPAEFYNSSLLESEKRKIEYRLVNTELKLLYVAPERFGDARFLQALKMTNKISLFAVDEAHCISVQGHDFRPSYRMLSNAITYLEPDQVIALTATATKRVQKDICEQLNIPNAKKFITGFYRPDLKLIVKTCNYTSKINNIIDSVKFQTKSGIETGIIYCPTRKLAEDLYKKLKNENINAILYHAGLTDQVRETTQNNWMKTGGIVVATIAFAMGIDKSDVRFVIHAGMPASIENYYQEIGRASRDGKGAYCTIYFDSQRDIDLQRFFIDMSYPPKIEITEFWKWCCKTADKSNMILMTQKEMGESCHSFMKSHFVSGCISKLKENGLIETIATGKYKINRDIDIHNAFDFVSLETKRRARLNTMNEMSEFIYNNKYCRMLQILEYFEDYSRTKECGTCDICRKELLRTKPVP